MGRISVNISNTWPRITIVAKRIKHGQLLAEEYSGYEVRHLKDNWNGILQVEFESYDGFIAAIPVREILNASPGNQIILADTRNGIPLCSKTQSKQYRLIAERDPAGRRWCKNIIGIEFVEVES